MKRKHTYPINKLPKDRTDLTRVKRLSEQAINRAAKSDPDASLLSEKDLAKFQRVQPPEDIDVKLIRKRLHLSQSVFAAYFGISKRTLQDWEQGRRLPKGPARTLLMIISREPKAVQRALLGK